MTLAPGTRFGPYEIVAAIGAGGMGEVYRAKDTKLGRDVAIKVLPEGFAEDSDRLRRFQQEARTLAVLSHPNVVQVFEAGEHEGAPYLVMELLEGETLRAKLGGRPLAPKRATEIAHETALGLAAAHGKGILHRDLKPENIFLTRDGRVKVLDFGLAKTHGTSAGSKIETRTVSTDISEPGHVVGTTGYMSPEQVRGEPLDARSDLFSLGIILWEMLTGKRPFTGESSVEVMHAILKDDLPDLDEALKVPPALERILRTSLAKEPAARFHSAHDLAFALDALSSSGSSSTGLPRVRGFRWAFPALASAAALLVVVLALGALAWSKHWPPFRPPSQPTFRQLTFREGWVSGARFTPDGQEVLLSANWEDQVLFQVYSLKLASMELRSAGVKNAQVQAISPSGEVAMTRDLRRTGGIAWRGDLGMGRLEALAPKSLVPNALQADLSPKGVLAVISVSGTRPQLECPPGHVRLCNGSGFLSPRFSLDGTRLAFIENPRTWDTAGRVCILDLDSGRTRSLTREFDAVGGLAWRGDELWFTAADQGNLKALWAVTLSGRERLVIRSPADLTLQDLAPDGRALLTCDEQGRRLFLSTGGQAPARELGTGQNPVPLGFSSDGTRFLQSDETERVSGENRLSLQPLPEGPAMLLGHTRTSAALSLDGAWVVAFQGNPTHPVLIPTGPGNQRDLPAHGIQRYGNFVRWTPDGKGLVFPGSKEGEGFRTYIQDAGTGDLRPLGPKDSYVAWITPDGRRVLTRTEGHWVLQDLVKPEGPKEPVSGIEQEDRILGWTPDSSRILLCRIATGGLQVFSLDPRTGQQNAWKRFETPGMQVRQLREPFLTRDGKALMFTNYGIRSTLYLVEGLK